MLYGVTGVVPLIAALYLLLCPVNAIAPGVTPPVRLRRWTAAFFGTTTLAHVWWLLFYIYSGDLNSTVYLVLTMLDFVLLFVTFAGMLLAKYRPHKLINQRVETWECHIEPDWLMTWNQNDTELTLLFLRTGTHSDLF